MKKVLTLLIAVIYAVASFGATVQLHYCMGTLVNFSLSSEDSHACSKCGMEKKNTGENGCCKDKKVLVKAEKSDTLPSSPYSLFAPSPAILDKPLVYTTTDFSASVFEVLPVTNAPPLLPASIYLYNCVFLI